MTDEDIKKFIEKLNHIRNSIEPYLSSISNDIIDPIIKEYENKLKEVRSE